jgi:hypothetical protein
VIERETAATIAVLEHALAEERAARARHDDAVNEMLDRAVARERAYALHWTALRAENELLAVAVETRDAAADAVAMLLGIPLDWLDYPDLAPIEVIAACLAGDWPDYLPPVPGRYAPGGEILAEGPNVA